MTTKTILAGKQLDKDDLIFGVLGDLDEVVAVIGLAKVKADSKQEKVLNKIQTDLSSFASFIAHCENNNIDQRLKWLEEKINTKENKIDISKKFVLPGENDFESRLNFARVVVRRAERKAVKLNKRKKLDHSFLVYLNKLSWLLFLLILESRK